MALYHGSCEFHRLVCLHSYDRARILEEYRLKRSPTVFVDTISLHMSLNGMSGGQVCARVCGVFNQCRVILFFHSSATCGGS